MNEEMHTLAGAYAVDALPPDERAFFERHLGACDTCQREVAELTALTAALGAAEREDPPPGLRHRVLTELDSTPQAPSTTAGPGEEPARQRRPRRARQRAEPLAFRAAAAAVALFVVLGGISGVLLNRVSTLEDELADSRLLAAVLSDPALRVVDVDAPPGSVARVLHAPGGDETVLLVEGLPPAPDEHAYQLWVLRDGAPVPDRLFQPDEHGRALITFDHAVTATDSVAATVEPDSGSAQPTGDIVLHGVLDA